MMGFLSVRGASLQRPHTTQRAPRTLAGRDSGAEARTGSFWVWVGAALLGCGVGGCFYVGVVIGQVLGELP